MTVDLVDRNVVVTGGASGIGRAMCRAFARQGVRGVAVADRNGDGAQAVADELTGQGFPAIAVTTDVSDEADVVALVAAAESAFGVVDVFCANAGIVVPGGIEVPDADWERMWSVNVQSHIFAARAVVPAMLERGEGYLVHTASAAGLLTQLGSAPYSVTKHAVVALAEWLSITHGDAGLRVSCLCPQGVWTAMTGADELGPHDATVSTVGRDGMLDPEVVADAVIDAMADEHFLILPHPEVATYEQRRAGDRERWLRAMRALQAQLVKLVT
jgi:NAD(P)-dependent dehydrogenase (short-subunit alcohol dehydrogenase family)